MATPDFLVCGKPYGACAWHCATGNGGHCSHANACVPSSANTSAVRIRFIENLLFDYLPIAQYWKTTALMSTVVSVNSLAVVVERLSKQNIYFTLMLSYIFAKRCSTAFTCSLRGLAALFAVFGSCFLDLFRSPPCLIMVSTLA